jgi:hypothetical protein
VALSLCSSGLASAAISAEEKEAVALRTTFPDADHFESNDVLLTDEMVSRIESLARARVRERLVTLYTAMRGGAVAGHAVIHSHIVRTKRETLLIAFEPDGRIRRVSVVAFLEPAEYRPADRWLRQFEGKGTGDKLAVGQDIAPITGATLTARGVSEQARWLLQALKLSILEAKR